MKEHEAAHGNSPRAFTLLEMLVAMAVFVILMGFLTFMVSGVQKAWVQGDQKVEIYQGGRAALELFARELSTAVVSEKMQFVQTPGLSTNVAKLATNSPSLFWMAPGQSTSKGNLCEVGYYLTRDEGAGTHQLNRFYLKPDNTNSYYLGTNSYVLQAAASMRPWSFANEALWITTLSPQAFDPADPTTAVSVVAEGVIAMWIRCLDSAGNPIPWLFEVPTYDCAPIQFNSGACFQMTSANAPFSGASTNFANTEKTFQYTAGPTTSALQTSAANSLPAFVEITLIMVDSRTLQKKPAVPSMPAATTATDVPTQIQAFHQALSDAGIRTARTLTTKVKLMNASH